MTNTTSATLRVARTITLPNAVQLERCRRIPELGPKVLFFSGGTALRSVSRRLVHYTHNSIHLITPFDSGGSSATIRQAFQMLAVGDLRNRIMALADLSVQGQPEVIRLFSFRFPKEATPSELRGWLDRMIAGDEPMVTSVFGPMREIIRQQLAAFRKIMPEGFDLRGASVGNLILAGGYLDQGRHIDAVIFLISKLIEARGTVRPITSADLHLVADLEDGRTLVGQHLITGKEAPPLDSPIRRLYLSRSLRRVEPVEVEVSGKVRDLIMGADLICYPIGSFYTSLVANLLPRGVGRAIAASDAPKLYIPNTSPDPEQLGLDLPAAVRRLLDYLRTSAGQEISDASLLGYVLIDSLATGIPASQIADVKRLGVEVIDMSLTDPARAPLIDPERLAQVLVSLA